MPNYNLTCKNNHEVYDIFLKIGERPPCQTCGEPTETLWTPTSVPNIVPDDIPGGVEIRHGLCWEDGTPRKFYSKSEIARAAKEKGLINLVEHVPVPGTDKALYTTKESGSVPWAGFKDYQEWDTYRTLHWWDGETSTPQVPNQVPVRTE